KVARTVLNGEGGETGFGTALCPYPTRPLAAHEAWRQIDHNKGEYVLLPTFRLPTLIHTRAGNAKWLYEISHTNPLWMHPRDAERLAVEGGALVQVQTETGYFV